MRNRFIPPVLALALFALLAATGNTNGDDLDKKVLDIVKQVGEMHKSAKSLHTEATVVTDADGDQGKRQTKVTAVYDLEKPNRLSLRTRVDGDDKAGPDIVCDGKKLFVHRKKQKEYTEAEPADLSDMGQTVLQLGFPNTGMLFANVLSADPYDALMTGVTECQYAGKEKVGGVDAHHLKFVQPGLDWELWVAAEGKPRVLKALSKLENGDRKVTITETYQNWKVDEPPAKDAFTFTPDKETKKVSEFSQKN